MKNNSLNKRTAILLGVLLLLSLSVYAKTPNLSPGLEILGKGLEMKKCGVVNNDVYFTPEEFEQTLGVERAEYITITSLPDSACGVLKIAGREILENQTISRRNLELLRYVPNYNTLSTGSFMFQDAADGGIRANCVVHILSDINLAPEARSELVVTQRNIAVSKFIKAADPENDALSFEIVKFPKKGRVTLVDEAAGYFMYLPEEGYTGKDEFTYTVSDPYGNKSKPRTVSLRVTKPVSDLFYDDLSKHWAHNSALRMTSMGLMSGEEIGGALCFHPEQDMTRGDFLAMAMIVTGHEKNVELCYATAFADDDSIPLNIKSYAETAMGMNVVSGYPSETGGYNFDPDKPITRAEAAVILDRLLEGGLPVISPEFTDAAAIPVWARDSVSKLVSCGVLKGTGYGQILPDRIVTKAEAAEMLNNAADYAKEQSQAEQKEKKGLFGLFGLFG